MLSEFSEKLKAKHIEQERKRIGDIYDECEKRGCSLDFLKTFDTRMCLYPIKQTNAFIGSPNKERYLPLWKIYLEVYIKLRPEDKLTDERKQSLAILNNFL